MFFGLVLLHALSSGDVTWCFNTESGFSGVGLGVDPTLLCPGPKSAWHAVLLRVQSMRAWLALLHLGLCRVGPQVLTWRGVDLLCCCPSEWYLTRTLLVIDAAPNDSALRPFACGSHPDGPIFDGYPRAAWKTEALASCPTIEVEFSVAVPLLVLFEPGTHFGIELGEVWPVLCNRK